MTPQEIIFTLLAASGRLEGQTKPVSTVLIHQFLRQTKWMADVSEEQVSLWFLFQDQTFTKRSMKSMNLESLV